MSNQNRKASPNANKIANYWADNLLKKHEDGTYYVPNLDIGEPACQGCNGWSEDSPDPSNWERTALEKAHIVGWAMGGSNDPSNFLLLCRHCHFDFDNEVCITDMKDFIEVSKWLQEREAAKSNKFKKLYNGYVSKNNLNESRFSKAFVQAKLKACLGREKSFEEYLHKIFTVASTVYPFITEEHAKMHVFEFMQVLKDQEDKVKQIQQKKEECFTEKVKILIKLSLETDNKKNYLGELCQKNVEEKGYDFTELLFECYEEMGLTVTITTV